MQINFAQLLLVAIFILLQFNFCAASSGGGMGFNMLDRIALLLVILGALNWGLVGIFQFDAVSWMFGGTAAIVSRIVYTLVALGGVWCVSLLFRNAEHIERSTD